jgi:DNA-directed RNA polymerase subunit N (RpoN/RPB10)|uniref:Uncharacterized protein n=1 Tax=viral metagenome TaxID=1070528 RepID=A0A6C0BMP4_9ZZZZ
MIIPMVCFSCGRPIAHLWDQYLKLVKDYEIQQRTQTQTQTQQAPQPETHTPEFLALRDLKIGRQCCRRMFLCQQDMYELIH